MGRRHRRCRGGGGGGRKGGREGGKVEIEFRLQEKDEQTLFEEEIEVASLCMHILRDICVRVLSFRRTLILNDDKQKN